MIDLGAKETAENVLVTDQWQAVLRQSKPVKIGSLVVGRIEVEFTGDPTAITAMLENCIGKLYAAADELNHCFGLLDLLSINYSTRQWVSGGTGWSTLVLNSKSQQSWPAAEGW